LKFLSGNLPAANQRALFGLKVFSKICFHSTFRLYGALFLLHPLLAALRFCKTARLIRHKGQVARIFQYLFFYIIFYKTIGYLSWHLLCIEYWATQNKVAAFLKSLLPSLISQ